MRRITLSILGFILLTISCTSRDTIVDKKDLLGADYRLFQETPAWELAKAVEDGDEDKIKEEINKNKNLVNFREPRFGKPLLILAVYNQNYNSAKALLESGADPNLQDSYYGDSALMKAASIETSNGNSDPRFLNLMLKYGGDPNAEQHGSMKTRNTPLMIASQEGSLEYIKILIDAGAKVDVVNKYGDSPLYRAMISAGIYRKPEIVFYLINKGANYRRVLYTTIEGENKYITDALRHWRFDLKSPEYKKKMQLVDFLKRHGMDYKKAPIPEWYYEDDKEYLEKY